MAPRPSLERLKARPHPRDWGDDDLLTLQEAAALFFPAGPLTASSLRIAARRGELGFVEICGKRFTTPAQLRKLVTPAPAQNPAPATAPAGAGFRAKPSHGARSPSESLRVALEAARRS